MYIEPVDWMILQEVWLFYTSNFSILQVMNVFKTMSYTYDEFIRCQAL